jgi:hypothetical protein
MSQQIYISYDGDEQRIGTLDADLIPRLMAQAMEDIVANMRVNYESTAEVTITIR